MRVTAVSVTLEKRVNDSDYGSERTEAHLAADLEATDDPMLVLGALLIEARTRVEADLRHSVNREVRRRMNPPLRLCNECGDPLGDEDSYLHKACDEAQKERRRRERAEQEAAWQAETARAVAELNGTTPPEAVAVGRGNGGSASAAADASGTAADVDDLDADEAPF